MISHSHEQSTPTEAQQSSMANLLRNLVADKGNIVDQLQLLYTDGDSKELDRVMTQLAISILRDTDEFKSNTAIVHNKHASEEIQRQAVTSQRQLLDATKRLIAQEAGIPLEAWLNELDAAKLKVRKILEEAAEEGKIRDKDDILLVLGMLQKDEENNLRFTYPEGLFPEFVDKQWGAYLESVVHHLDIESQVKAGLTEKVYLSQADTARRLAHNTVSRSVQQILGIENWTIEEARKLLAKMRDNRFPTIETAESARTAEGIASGLGSSALIAVLELLSSKKHS